MPTEFDIAPLQQSITRLEAALALYQQNPSQTVIHDGPIRRFEFTYGVPYKLLRRWLMSYAATPDLSATTNFADIIRLGNENDLQRGDWPRWKSSRDLRSRTSHSYDEAIAMAMVAGTPAFFEEARCLRDQLPKRSVE